MYLYKYVGASLLGAAFLTVISGCVITKPYIEPVNEKNAVFNFSFTYDYDVALVQYLWLDPFECKERRMAAFTPEEIRAGKTKVKLLADKEIAVGIFQLAPIVGSISVNPGYISIPQHSMCSYIFSFVPQEGYEYSAVTEIRNQQCNYELVRSSNGVKAVVSGNSAEKFRLRISNSYPRESELACQK